MPTAWRIVKIKNEKNAFTGEGARRYGGRWNSPGQAVIYTAQTLSGAVLEILIHGNRQLLSYYHVFRLEIPNKIILVTPIDGLPDNWRSSPPPLELAQLGDSWCIEQRAAVLCVPNAIVPMETNYLVNPTHDDFRLIEIEGPLDYFVDERLF